MDPVGEINLAALAVCLIFGHVPEGEYVAWMVRPSLVNPAETVEGPVLAGRCSRCGIGVHTDGS